MSEEAPVQDNVEAQQVETTETLLPESGEVQTGWKFAEGIDGMGEKPEWFAEKFATVADQAKAYKDLESRFGSFTGAPKDGYKAELSEEFKEKGLELDPDSPLLEKAMEMAKELNMSQDGFNRMMELYMMEKLSEVEAQKAFNEEYITQQKKELGNNADQLLKDLSDFGRVNLPEDLFDTYQGMVTDAKSARVFAELMGKIQESPVSPNSTPAPGITKQDLHEMQFKTNENGQRLIQVDPEYRAMWQEKMEAYYGKGEHRVEIG